MQTSSMPLRPLTTRKSMFKKLALTTLIASGFAALAAPADAADAVWNVNLAGTWGTDDNWDPATAPGGVATVGNPDTATFGTIISAARVVTVDASRNIFGIDFAGNSSAYTLSGGNLLLSNGGLIQTSGGGSNHTDTISSPITLQGNATFAANSTTAGRILAITGAITGSASTASVITLEGTGTSNSNTLSGIIADGTGGAVSIVKSGTGNWTLGNTGNTFTGGITINEGILNVASDVRLGNANNVITLNGGTLQQTTAFNILGTHSIKLGSAGGTLRNNATSGNMTSTAVISDAASGAGALTITGAGGTGAYNPASATQHTYTGGTHLVSSLVIVSNASVGSASTSDLVSGPFGTGTLHFDGASMRTTTSAGTYIVGNEVQFNATTTFAASGQQLTFTGPVKLNGTQTINQTAIGNVNFTGAISDLTPGSGLTLGAASTGRLVLSGANTYTGPTTVSAGTLTFMNTVSMPGYPAPTAGQISVGSGGTLSLGYGAAAGQFSAADVGVFAAPGTPITFAATGAAIGLDTTNAVGGLATYGGVIANPTAVELGFTKDGAGTLTLTGSNTYTGATTIAGGSLSVDSLNNVAAPAASSGLGAPTDAATGVIQLGSGTAVVGLIYTGAGETTDRGVNLSGTTGAVTLNQSGTGLLKFTTDFTATGAGAKTLTLTGTGDGEIDAVIPNSSSATALTKTGTGTWTLSKVNTYTGLTNITGGTLAYGISDAIATGNVTINGAGATLDLGLDHTDTVGVVTLANGTITGTGTSALTSTGNYDLRLGVSDVPLLGTGNATKTTAGIVTLNGASNYSGVTTVNAGILTFGQRTGFYDGIPANWTDANFIVNTGGTLAFGVGGAAGFTAADIDVLKNVSSGTGGFQTGSSIGFDTTGGDFVYASGIANPGSAVRGLVKLGTNKLTINGPLSYTGNTLLHEGTLAIGANSTLAGNVTYGITNTSAIVGGLEINDDVTVNGTFLVQTNSATANTLAIAAGKTLTVNNTFTVGSNGGGGTTTVLESSGGGKLLINNTASGSLVAIGGSNGAGSRTTADLSGLGEVVISLNTTNGIVRVNPNSGTNIANYYSTLKLPTTGPGNTTITADILAVGDAGQNGGTGFVNSVELGSGVNTLHVNTINVGTGLRDQGSITFGTANGSLIVRDSTGSGRANLNIASLGGGTGLTGVPGNTFDVSGHQADILINALTIGTQNRGHTMNNTFAWDQGTLDALSLSASIRNNAPTGTVTTPFVTNTTVTIGSANSTLADTAIFQNGVLSLASATGSTTSAAANVLTSNATLNIGGGTVTIGSTSGDSIRMATASKTTGTTPQNNVANAVINITGGETTLSGHIVHVGGAGIATSTLKLSGGSLNMGNQNIGGTAAANNVTNLLFESGTLSNVGQINNGAVLDKTTAGTLTLAGSNAYTGGTTINEGVLVAASSGALGTGTVTVNGTGQVLAIDGPAAVNVGGIGNLAIPTDNTLRLSEIGDQFTLTPGSVFTLGDITLDLSNAFNVPGIYTVIDSSPGFNTLGTTTFAGADQTNYTFSFAIINDDAVLTVTAIPEPSTLVLGSLLALGLVAHGIRQRRLAKR